MNTQDGRTQEIRVLSKKTFQFNLPRSVGHPEKFPAFIRANEGNRIYL